jgi:hypothetical protein
LDIYSHLEQESGATLSNPACNNMVVEEVTREFNRAKDTPIIMHGRRVESMFL